MQKSKPNKHGIINAFALVKHLRYKYAKSNDSVNSKALTHLMSFSVPLVYSEEEWQKVSKAFQNRKQKKKRANAYLFHMQECYDELHFFTFTFTDDVLSSTTEETRKKYVQRWMDTFARDYYANQDFTPVKHREHYHSVVATTDSFKYRLCDAIYRLSQANETRALCNAPLLKISDFDDFGWKYGFVKVEPVRKDFKELNDQKQNTYRLSSYMTKLANHSGKIGTGKSFHKRGFKEVDNIPFL